jgi:putative endonuclease
VARAGTIPVSARAWAIIAAMRAARRFIPASEWRDGRHRRGLRGELAALAYLTACGWKIEAHRFRLGRHDVDLVARRAGVVAFVEVKSRNGGGKCGAPAEAVGPRKRAILARVAACWLARYGRSSEVGRFDVVSVIEGSGGAVVVEHTADAWRI